MDHLTLPHLPGRSLERPTEVERFPWAAWAQGEGLIPVGAKVKVEVLDAVRLRHEHALSEGIRQSLQEGPALDSEAGQLAEKPVRAMAGYLPRFDTRPLRLPPWKLRRACSAYELFDSEFEKTIGAFVAARDGTIPNYNAQVQKAAEDLKKILYAQPLGGLADQLRKIRLQEADFEPARRAEVGIALPVSPRNLKSRLYYVTEAYQKAAQTALCRAFLEDVRDNLLHDNLFWKRCEDAREKMNDYLERLDQEPRCFSDVQPLAIRWDRCPEMTPVPVRWDSRSAFQLYLHLGPAGYLMSEELYDDPKMSSQMKEDSSPVRGLPGNFIIRLEVEVCQSMSQ